MTRRRPDDIGVVQWLHMEGAERSIDTSGARAADEGISAHALRSIAHSMLALTALLTDRLPHREPTPADLAPIPPAQLAHYRMLSGDGETVSNWQPVWDGMRMSTAGGIRYEFRTTRPGDTRDDA